VPIYDYRCDHCGHAFSAVQSFKDEPLEKCPNCGKRPRRLIVASAVVFKGSGWYKTDSRGKAPKEEGAPASTDAKTEKKSETKTEAKPADSKPASESKPATESKPASETKS
jgi:putative FmdB family regulatory protein